MLLSYKNRRILLGISRFLREVYVAEKNDIDIFYWYFLVKVQMKNQETESGFQLDIDLYDETIEFIFHI